MAEQYEANSSDLFPGFENIDEFLKDAYQTVINTTMASNQLPKKANYTLCSTFPTFRNFLQKQEEKILNTIQKTYTHHKFPHNIHTVNLKKKIDYLHEFNEKIFDRVESNLNRLTGQGFLESDQIIIEAENMTKGVAKDLISSNSTPKSATVMRAILAKNVVRPQNTFKDQIDNSIDTPWEPLIKDKPNSIRPLAIFLEETNDEFGRGYSHAYEMELDQFKPSESMLTKLKPVYPKSVDSVPIKMVTTVSELQEMNTDLLKYKEIAVDLEHHSYRTFLGITCLMQVSTTDTDYIVDTLALRNDLHILNEVFTKPSIVKVFHGAVLDIQWLQRDLSLYIVNMFDTHIAAKHLNYKQLSLASLILKFFKRTVDKSFQLADWRIRPLPEELISYAREDTHYLLYIYHKLRNELIDADDGGTTLLTSVIHQSTLLCKQRYVKPVYNNETYLKLYHSSRKTFNNQQLYAMKQLYHWREMTARKEDESLGYVLPTHMLLQIAETLPREEQGILACCNPVPPLIRQNLYDLHRLVINARLEPLEKPILKAQPATRQQQFGCNWESPLHCPHDLSKSEDFVEGLPTLLTSNVKLPKVHILKTKPTIAVYDQVPMSTDENLTKDAKANIDKVRFLCPYDRYKLIKEYAESENKKLTETKKTEEVAATEDDNTQRISKLYEKVNKLVEEVFANEIKLSDISVPEDQDIPSEPEPNPAPRTTDLPKEELSLNEMNRKRKRQEDYLEFSPSKIPKTSDFPIVENHEPLPKTITIEKKKHKARRPKRPKNNDGNKDDKQNTSEATIEKGKDNKEDKLNTSEATIEKGKRKPEKSKEFKAFDYNNVDFNRFQGGSHVQNKNKEPNSKFKGKGKNKKYTGKRNNKTQTFPSNAFNKVFGGSRKK